MYCLLNNAFIFSLGLVFGGITGLNINLDKFNSARPTPTEVLYKDNENIRLSSQKQQKNSNFFDKMHMDLYKIANKLFIANRKLHHLGQREI